MISSIKFNFALNLANTVSRLLFPLITFPYVSRILLAEGIGQVQFFQGIIDYISLCSALGIPLYAVREVARVRNDKACLCKMTVEILLLHSALTLMGYGAVYVLVATVAKIQMDIPLFLLLSASLFFDAIGGVWFYQGIEDFKYITIRGIAVRIFSLICLFVFVRSKSDLFYYAAIIITANAGGNLFNFVRLRKHLDTSLLCLKELRLLRHLRPALHLFAINVINSIFINLDTVMLGFMKSEAVVGYYTVSIRITGVILGIVQSLGAVLLPHLTNLASHSRMEEFRQLVNKALSFTLAISLPLTVGLIFMAKPLIHLFVGHRFEPAILTVQIMAPLILFISISRMMCWQILFPLNEEKKVFYTMLAGAAVNFVMNLLFIPSYSQYGAGGATCVAEGLVAVIAIAFARRTIPIQLFSQRNFHYCIVSLCIAVSLYVWKNLVTDETGYVLVGVLSSALIYGGYLWYKKDTFILQIKRGIVNLLVQKVL